LLSAQAVMARKGESQVVLVSAHDAITARIVEAAGADVILVGDSLGVTALGHPSIMPVTLDVMVHHVAAVSRVTERSLVVADMPFGCYGVSAEVTLKNAVRLVKEARAGAVKMAGGAYLAPEVERLVAVGIPVMGHIGLLSHAAWFQGHEQPVGRDHTSHQQLLADAMALTQAGCFGLIAKGVVPSVTREICAAVGVPVISIGSGPADGFGANVADVLGLGGGRRSWYSVRQWEGAREMTQILSGFVTAARSGRLVPPGAGDDVPDSTTVEGSPSGPSCKEDR
jgi:3-methyl-2-oxobutanoate hydroxymethyltransferase